jgi:hypothetical protein
MDRAGQPGEGLDHLAELRMHLEQRHEYAHADGISGAAGDISIQLKARSAVEAHSPTYPQDSPNRAMLKPIRNSDTRETRRNISAEFGSKRGPRALAILKRMDRRAPCPTIACRGC